MTYPKRQQKGAISIIAVLVISALLMTVLLLSLQQNNTMQIGVLSTLDSAKALYLAESGLERASARYASIACTSLPEAAVPFAGGSIGLTRAVVNGSACDIQITASVNTAVRVITASLGKAGSSYTAWAVGKKGTIIGKIAGIWTLVKSNVKEDLKGVACLDSNYCIAVGKHGWVTVWNGSSWRATRINKDEDYEAISCSPTNANFCVIVGKGESGGNKGVTRIWNRSLAQPWLSPVRVKRELKAVACPGAICVAVGKEDKGYVVRGDASSWSSPESTNMKKELRAVSCTESSATNCWAVSKKKDKKFRLAQRPGGTKTWQEVSGSFGAAKKAEDLEAISCLLGSGTCWAVGKKGSALFYDGGKWDYRGSIHKEDMKGISCRESDGECIAAGKKGALVRLSNGSWSNETTATKQELNAVSYIDGGTGGAGVTILNWRELVAGS
ncbi:MAG: hypothetical protein ACC707_15270 [Thiohalomonadales bacterium]